MVLNATVCPAHPDPRVAEEQKGEQRRSLATLTSLDLETSFESLLGLWPWFWEGTRHPGRTALSEGNHTVACSPSGTDGREVASTSASEPFPFGLSSVF